MTIRFEPESRRVFDDETGDYLENELHHFPDPLHHYRLRSDHGETQSSADVGVTILRTIQAYEHLGAKCEIGRATG